MLLSTPEGKVYGAENYTGVEDVRLQQSTESQRLRKQYERIRKEILLQEKAAISAGKTLGLHLKIPCQGWQCCQATISNGNKSG